MIAIRATALFLLLTWMSSLFAAKTAEQAESKIVLDATISQYRSEGAEKSLPEFEKLHVQFEQNGDLKNAAVAEHYVGECHWRLGNFGQSRQHLEAALAESKSLGERLAEGRTLNVLGLLEWDLGNYDQAIALFNQASVIGSEIGNRRLAGSTMNNLSLVYDELGDYNASLEQYEQALELYDGADFPRGVSDTLGNIGGVKLLLGRYQEALSYYERALKISEQLGSKSSMSLDHGNMAFCYLGLGQLDLATQHVDQALQLSIDTGMRKEEALWLRAKGTIQIRQGRYDLGLENHRAALEIYEEINTRGALMNALRDMGQMHLLLGDPISAEQYFQRGVDLALELGAAPGVTANLLALGDLQLQKEQLDEAEALYRQVRNRATKAGELNFQAESLLRLSQVHSEQGRHKEAENEARQALTIAVQTGAINIEARAWYAIGEIARLDEKPDAALGSYGKSQEAIEAARNTDLLWQIHYGKARALIQLGSRTKAVTELEQAIRLIESVRERLREERFRAGYVQDKYAVYIALVRLQLELGQTQNAFSTAERLRARSFMDQLERQDRVAMSERESLTETAIRERLRQLETALEEENGLPAPDRRQKALDTFSGELAQAEREYQSFLDDISRRTNVGQTSQVPSLWEVQARLLPGQALLEYVVDADRVMIFIMTSDRLSALSTEINRQNLFAKVSLVRDLIQDASTDLWWTPAASLAETLIEPLRQDKILEGVDHLFLVPHSILNYLPFALLPIRAGADRSVLVEKFSLVYLPAAATLVRNRLASPSTDNMLAMAPQRTGLRYSLEEARAIATLYQPGSRLLAGETATESAFKKHAGDFEMLHLSTHGYFNSRNPLLSGLELEPDGDNDGRLEVHEILQLSLNARLVTLSACETGMGSGYFDQIPAGDDFVSLTRAFLLAGSHTVLASLWEVDDRSTVELMEGFYTRLTRGNNDTARSVALARTQRELRQSKHYHHPFYWAPFILVGQQVPPEGAQLFATRG